MDMNYLKKPTLADSYKLLHQGTIALANAEMQGLRIDIDYVREQREKLTQEIVDTENRFRSTRFYKDWVKSRNGKEPNYNSNPQVKKYLYEVKGYTPAKYTGKGKTELKEYGRSDKGSTDEEALKELGIKELDYILRIRKLKKIRDTYLENIERETVRGYLHPMNNLHTARTFRSSVSFPNTQNIPSRDPEAMKIVRSAIYPRPGHQLMEVDYKSLEVSIAACINQDPTMLKYLREGGDMHKDIGEEIFKLEIDKTTKWGDTLRKATKNGFVFPQFYGDYFGNNAIHLCQWVGLPKNKRFRPGQGIELEKGTIADHLRENGIKTFQDFVNHLEDMQEDLWENRFPVYADWKEKIWQFYKDNGYIESPTGFRFTGAMRKNDTSNYPIQASAFHVLLKSFTELDWIMRSEGWDTKLIGQIHDSIIIDVLPSERDYVIEKVKQVTTKKVPKEWPWIIVPLNVEFEICPVDGSWAEKDKLTI